MPETPNYLADDIRYINEWQDIPDDIRQYVTKLADRVQRLGDQPVEVDASTDLTVTSGLEPEQEIRDRALSSASNLLAPKLSDMSLTGIELNVVSVASLWVDLAEHGTAYITDGSKPA